MKKIVLIGLGNPVLGDDAVGLRVAERVQRLLEEHPVPGASVALSTRGGFELLDLLAGTDAAIVVDCVAVAGGRPGTVRELSIGQLAGCTRLLGSHDIGLAQVVNADDIVVIERGGRAGFIFESQDFVFVCQ